MDRHWDVIVVGVGTMGSHALWRMARQGLKVLGIEQYQLGHELGGASGGNRVIRQAYYEDPRYVPLMQQAYRYWQDLAEESNEEIIRWNGVLISGTPDSEVILGVQESCRQHQLPVHRLDPKQVTDFFPALRCPENHVAMYEPQAGSLSIGPALREAQKQATTLGASILTHEAVISLRPSGSHGQVVVKTKSQEFTAQKVVVTVGGWVNDLFKRWALPIELRRKIQIWYQAGAQFDVANDIPCFLFDLPEGVFYGLPRMDGQTLKISEHSGGALLNHPRDLGEGATGQEIARLNRFAQQCLPTLTPKVLKTQQCIYDNTPDRHFILETHPQLENVMVAAGFSGHGFKFAPAIGEHFATWALSGQRPVELDFLSLQRLRRR